VLGNTTKVFDIGTVLSVIYATILTELENYYKILQFMINNTELYTHQLPRADKFCAKFLLAQYPQLEEWEIYDPQINPDNWQEFLQKAKDMFGEYLEVEQLPEGVFDYKDPEQEAEEMFGKDKIIRVDLPKKNNPLDNFSRN
jgi:hypothetical protein